MALKRQLVVKGLDQNEETVTKTFNNINPDSTYTSAMMKKDVQALMNLTTINVTNIQLVETTDITAAE